MYDLALDENLSAAFRRGIEAGEDMTPAMAGIASYLETETRLRFETSTAPSGAKWKDSKRVEQDGGLTLVLSGDLRSSIASGYGSDFAEVGPERSYGSAVYALIHQEGGIILPKGRENGGADALNTPFGPRGSVTIPARPYAGFSADDPGEIARILTTYLANRIGGTA